MKKGLPHQSQTGQGRGIHQCQTEALPSSPPGSQGHPGQYPHQRTCLAQQPWWQQHTDSETKPSTHNNWLTTVKTLIKKKAEHRPPFESAFLNQHFTLPFLLHTCSSGRTTALLTPPFSTSIFYLVLPCTAQPCCLNTLVNVNNCMEIIR